MDPTIIRQMAKQTCSADNITIMRGQIMRLHDIRSMLWANIRMAEREKNSAALINNVIFSLQMVKATCDVVIAVAGEIVPKAAVISNVYSGLQANTGNVGNLIAGQQVGGADFARGATAGLNSIVKHRLGMDSDLLDFADLTKVKTDMVINAAALDQKELLASVAEYKVTLTAWATKASGYPGASKLIKSGHEVIKAGAAYHSAYTEWKNSDLDATFDAGIALSRRQLSQISIQIVNVEQALIGCGAEIKKPHTASIGLLTGNFTGPTIRAAR